MVIRIVKMVFREEEIETFASFFETRKELIRGVAGCRHLQLWQDRTQPAVFFTYSWWDGEEALEAYRKSPFFAETWQLTKAMFAARAEAWTVDALHRLD
jgi:heme-degrading monooxygenase HmoA